MPLRAVDPRRDSEFFEWFEILHRSESLRDPSGDGGWQPDDTLRLPGGSTVTTTGSKPGVLASNRQPTAVTMASSVMPCSGSLARWSGMGRWKKGKAGVGIWNSGNQGAQARADPPNLIS